MPFLCWRLVTRRCSLIHIHSSQTCSCPLLCYQWHIKNTFVASPFCTELSCGLYKNVWIVVYWFNFAFLIPAEYCHTCKSNLQSYPDINRFFSLYSLIFTLSFCCLVPGLCCYGTTLWESLTPAGQTRGATCVEQTTSLARRRWLLCCG